MMISVIFLTLLSTSFGTHSGFVSAPVEFHQPVPVNIKSHSFATEVQHDVPVAAPATVAVHAPKSIHAVEPIVAAPKSIVSAPAITSIKPVEPLLINSYSHATGIQHDAPVAIVSPAAIGAAPKSIHTAGAVAAPPAIVSAVDIHAPKSIHTPLAAIEAPLVKEFSYATEIHHNAPVAAVAPVSLHAVPKSIHAVKAIAPAPAIAPIANVHAPKSIHTPLAPIEAPVIKQFSYATEIQHNAPVAAVSPVSLHAVPKSIHTIAPAPAIAPIVDIRVPQSIHVPYEVPGVNAFSYATEVKHQPPVAVPVPIGTPQKSIHAVEGSVLSSPAVVPVIDSIAEKSIYAPSAIIEPPLAPVVDNFAPKSIHAPATIVEPPVIKSFSHTSEIQHNVPVASPAIGAVTAPKSIHSLSAVHPNSVHVAPAVAPVVTIHSPKSIHAPAGIEAPLVKSFSYGTGIQHDAAIAVEAPVVSAPKSIHASAVPAVSPLAVHPAEPLHAADITLHNPISPVLTSAVPISHVNYPLATKLIRNAPVVVTSPVDLRSPLAKIQTNLAYNRAVPVTAQHDFNVQLNNRIYGSHLHPDFYARIAAPGAYLWNGNPVNNGVSYIAGTVGPLAYRPVPVYYRNFVNPTNAVYHYLKGK